MILKLVVDYKDGTQEIITSQPDSWKVLTDGLVKLGNIFPEQTYESIY